VELAKQFSCLEKIFHWIQKMVKIRVKGEMEDGRWKTGDGRWETEDGRREMEGGRQMTALKACLWER
jgi:hypothetical protein